MTIFKSINNAHTLGLRAGGAEPHYQRPGGTRGMLCHCRPLNPYNNPFTLPYRPLLAWIWGNAYRMGEAKRITDSFKKREYPAGSGAYSSITLSW